MPSVFQGNELESVPTAALSVLSSLRRLNLRHSRLNYIDAFAFRGLHQLQYLDIGDNHLPLDIDNDAFCDLGFPARHAHPRYFPRAQKSPTSSPPVDYVVIAPSNYSSGGRPVFGAPGPYETAETEVGLTVLRLDHNGLSSISPCAVKSVLRTLRRLDLTGNPLTCDCKLVGFIARTTGSRSPAIVNSVLPVTDNGDDRKSTGVVYAGAQCARPPRLGGVYLDR